MIAGTEAAAAARERANATKASGAIIRMDPKDFVDILSRTERPILVHAPAGFLGRKHAYLTSYKGLIFYTRSDTELGNIRKAELVEAKSIWIPD